MTDNTQFVLNPATDECVDPEWVLIKNMNITVQNATAYGGGYCVNEIKGQGKNLCLIHHGSFRFKHDAFAAALRAAA